MELQITTLIENNPDDEGKLRFEHGFALFIEADGKNILFDTGQSGAFIENAKTLNKNLKDLDYILMSHGHYDHSGGFEKLVSEVDKLPPVIVGEEFFKAKYKTVDEQGQGFQFTGNTFDEQGQGFKFIGNSFDDSFLAKNHLSLIKVTEDMVYLTEHLIIFHHFIKQTDYEVRNNKFFIKEDSDYIPDNFDDEISLGIITKKGLVVVVGCAHVGIVNILKTISERIHIPIYAVIGGTHLVDADEVRRSKTIDAFKEMKLQLIAVSHCTGEEGIRAISQEMKDQFIYNNTGKVIRI
jgi:7,8-dihydropterin-6-yl-methyl-4-(beta-D-ribofuranosyl)aminobenzene 5'-phosphate synthase